MLDSHVDLNENNVKRPGYNLNSKNKIYLDINQTKILELEFMENEVTLDDAINKWFFGQSEFSFISQSNKYGYALPQLTLERKDKVYGVFKFSADSKKLAY